MANRRNRNKNAATEDKSRAERLACHTGPSTTGTVTVPFASRFPNPRCIPASYWLELPVCRSQPYRRVNYSLSWRYWAGSTGWLEACIEPLPLTRQIKPVVRTGFNCPQAFFGRELARHARVSLFTSPYLGWYVFLSSTF